jgi:hypothetical protein
MSLCVSLSHLHVEIDVILSSVDGHSRNPTESATVLTITLSANSQTEVSDTALHRAEESIDMMETWSSAVDVIKQVMDAVSPIAAVCTLSFCFSPSLR